MKHSIHIGFGKGFSNLFLRVTELLKQEMGTTTFDYFKPLILYNNGLGSFVVDHIAYSSSDNAIPKRWYNEQIPDFYIREQVISDKERDEQIEDLFNGLFNEIINIGSAGSSGELRLCLCLPLWEKESVDLALQLINLLTENENRFVFDLLGFTSDLSETFKTNEEEISCNKTKMNDDRIQTKHSVEVLCQEFNNNDRIQNNIIIQNKQIDGISLNLNNDLLTRIISEFITLYIENQPNLLPNSVKQDNKVKGLGVSVLQFDKRYFCDYLLSKVYCSILERERINDDHAEVNTIANRVNSVISKSIGEHPAILTHVWSNNIEPLINKGVNSMEIVEAVSPQIDIFIRNLSDDLQAFLISDSFSLPEKRAGLASLLGEDDELFEGEIYDHNIPIIDDCEFEVVDFFIKVNNQLAEIKDKDFTEYTCLKSEADQTGKVTLPLKEIKRIKNTIRDSTQTIRELEKRKAQILEAIELDEIADKVLIEGNTFIYGNKKYKIYEKPVSEQLLEETYSPSNHYPKEIDLREGFSNIKNQGETGACSAYASVGAFEYLSHSEIVFSESFVYFMARTYDKSTDTDEGSSIYLSIRALSEFGVCEKKFWDDTVDFSKEPDIIAKDNALNHRVTKALNINHNISDFKSSIAEGYPICIVIKVFESFGKSIRGFITTPTEEEIKNGKGGYHAVVICGYSDEKRIFIVRNSWGKEFGDNGYCYIPYSYLENPELLTQAFIIKEISTNLTFIVKVKTVVNFDSTDKMIEYAILRNLINEEKLNLYRMNESYKFFKRMYISITNILTRIASRNQLLDGKIEYLAYIGEIANKKKETLVEEKEKSLKAIQINTNRVFLYGGLGFVISAIIIIISFFIFQLQHVLKSDLFWFGFSWITLSIVFLLTWKIIRSTVYKKSKQKWNELIEKSEQDINKVLYELKTIKLKFNIAGQIHVKMFELKQTIINKHKIMKSYVGNLIEWYKKEKSVARDMSPLNKPPLHSLIRNETLDQFYLEKNEELSNELRLSDFINKYELTEDGIIQFKKDLKNLILNRLIAYTNDFNIYDFLTNEKYYPYLEYNQDQISNYFSLMGNMSKAFLKPKSHTVNFETHKILGIMKNDFYATSKWEQIINNSFNPRPLEVKINDKTKIIMAQLIDVTSNDLSFMN